MATTVKFDKVDATDVTVLSGTELSVTVPLGNASGAADVIVTTSAETAKLSNGYTYLVPSTVTLAAADPAGSLPANADVGTITITGANLSDVGGTVDARTYTLAYRTPDDVNIPVDTPVTVTSDTEIITNPGTLGSDGNYYWTVLDADQNEVSNRLLTTVGFV